VAARTVKLTPGFARARLSLGLSGGTARGVALARCIRSLADSPTLPGPVDVEVEFRPGTAYARRAGPANLWIWLSVRRSSGLRAVGHGCAARAAGRVSSQPRAASLPPEVPTRSCSRRTSSPTGRQQRVAKACDGGRTARTPWPRRAGHHARWHDSFQGSARRKRRHRTPSPGSIWSCRFPEGPLRRPCAAAASSGQPVSSVVSDSPPPEARSSSHAERFHWRRSRRSAGLSAREHDEVLRRARIALADRRGIEVDEGREGARSRIALGEVRAEGDVQRLVGGPRGRVREVA
jgi:hypothetical protein